ncbi:MAG: glycosyltransferase family 4 protein [Planctomycetota bacterium]
MARILIVGDAASPFWERGLVGTRAGHRVWWFSDARRALPGVEEMLHPPPAPRRAAGAVRALALARMIERLRPDLVHVHFALQGLASVALWRAQRLVLTVMGGDVQRAQPQLGSARKRWLLRRTLARARVVTCQAAALERDALACGARPEALRRVTWGVDARRFCPDLETAALRRRYQLGADEPVLFCARLCQPLYNKELVLRAFARAARSGAPGTLLIATLHADPGTLGRLRALSEELEVARRVRFLPPIGHEEMPLHFALAALTLSLPAADGLPQSVLEAMAAGSYPIVGDLAAYDELLLDREHGRRVPFAVDALSAAIGEALADEAGRREVAARNRERVLREWGTDAQAALMNRIYAEVLA